MVDAVVLKFAYPPYWWARRTHIRRIHSGYPPLMTPPSPISIPPRPCVCVCVKYVILNLSIPWDLRPSVASPQYLKKHLLPPSPISWIQTIILSDTQSCVFKDSSSKPPRFSLLPLPFFFMPILCLFVVYFYILSSSLLSKNEVQS